MTLAALQGKGLSVPVRFSDSDDGYLRPRHGYLQGQLLQSRLVIASQGLRVPMFIEYNHPPAHHNNSNSEGINMSNEASSISVWKVIGGAAAGVAVVSAAPVAAPVALGLGALSGGLLGTVVGVLGSRDKAFLADKYKDVLSHFEEAVGQLKDEAHYNQLLAAMVAVSVSCAASDGDIARQEKSGINEFLKELTSTRVSPGTKAEIKSLIKDPPEIDAAFAQAKGVGLESLDLFGSLIELIIQADYEEKPGEIAFRDRWQELASTA